MNYDHDDLFDDLFDDDPSLDGGNLDQGTQIQNQPQDPIPPQDNGTQSGSSSTGNSGSNDDGYSDLISHMLKAKGISNPESIKYEDETTGAIVEKRFNELPLEERIGILTATDSEQPTYPINLSDDEKELFDTLAENNISWGEYIQYVQEQAILEFQRSAEIEAQSIDSIPDEQLYMLDIKSRFPDLTDDEIIEALNIEKSNQYIWNKKVEGLREVYKEREREAREEAELLAQQERDQSDYELREQIIDSLVNLDSIGQFELEDEDKEEIFDFITNTDVAGERYIARTLKDPNKLVEMAWFALNGETALKNLENYYVDQMKAYNQASYNKGYEEGLKAAGKTTKKSEPSSVVVKNTANPTGVQDPDLQQEFHGQFGDYSGMYRNVTHADIFSDDDL